MMVDNDKIIPAAKNRAAKAPQATKKTESDSDIEMVKVECVVKNSYATTGCQRHSDTGIEPRATAI